MVAVAVVLVYGGPASSPRLDEVGDDDERDGCRAVPDRVGSWECDVRSDIDTADNAHETLADCSLQMDGCGLLRVGTSVVSSYSGPRLAVDVSVGLVQVRRLSWKVDVVDISVAKDGCNRTGAPRFSSGSGFSGTDCALEIRDVGGWQAGKGRTRVYAAS